ncbi:MAG: phosphatase PAP2 family protein [Phycisphaerales bacterium]|nr:MAG: phosphatase PAP2 family protein [Phycisphaerales bacterium]
MLMTCLVHATLSHAESVPRDLSDGEEAAVLGASAGLLVLGHLAKVTAKDSDIPYGYRPNVFDRWMRGLFLIEQGSRSNFLDNRRGSAVSPLATVLALSLLDINRREFSRDIPFFLAGVAATKGITDLSKSLVGRPRPCCTNGICPNSEGTHDDPYHSHSFFSGHASSAFYSATFFNNRFRRHMRLNWTESEYRTGRVLSPLLVYGWATFVGMSRIHADRHFFTDVLAGAIVGTLMGELYYHLSYESNGPGPNGARPAVNAPLIILSFSI